MPRPAFRHEIGKHPNEGARLLWLAMNRRKMSPNEAAGRLDINSGLLYRWLFCDGKPGRALAERVRKLFQIPLRAWDEPPSTEFDLAKLRTGTDG